MADQYFYGTGRRKTAVARVRLYPGNGAVVVNGKPLEEVFSRDIHRAEVLSPLTWLGREGRYSAQVKCEGGGVSGWAGAIQMGIARALVASDPSNEPARIGFAYASGGAGSNSWSILKSRGYSDADIDGIFHGNWLRFFTESLPKGS